jgi:hypothetical protein
MGNVLRRKYFDKTGFNLCEEPKQKHSTVTFKVEKLVFFKIISVICALSESFYNSYLIFKVCQPTQ